MSELRWNWVYYPYLDAPNKQEESALKAGYIKVVSKSEADKVIAEKDRELRHHKYKRCLAMADLCQARYDEEDAKVNGRYSFWDYTSDEMEYWERWHNRWLELAKKFKEVKNG